jgi:hypothetical protein
MKVAANGPLSLGVVAMQKSADKYQGDIPIVV